MELELEMDLSLGVDSGPLQGQQVFITTELSLQPFSTFFFETAVLIESITHQLARLAVHQSCGILLSASPTLGL